MPRLEGVSLLFLTLASKELSVNISAEHNLKEQNSVTTNQEYVFPKYFGKVAKWIKLDNLQQSQVGKP